MAEELIAFASKQDMLAKSKQFWNPDATWIAAEAGVRVPANTRVLLAPFDLVVPEEPLAHEKLCPVLGLVRVPSARRGIDAARAVLRLSGRGHSAAIHSSDPRVIMEYGAAVEVLRVAVNAGNSLGSAGLETNLAPTMTIGTGFFGRSSMAENLHPSHLVQWTRLAYNSDRAEAFGDFTGLVPWQAPAGPIPPYPVASNHEDGRHGNGDGGSRAGTTARSVKIEFQPDAAALITMLDPQQAFLVNRNKIGSMALAGESLFVLEMQPASYAILAANEAEKAARIKLVDYRMIGATGRLYLSGSEADVLQAAGAAEDALRSLI